MCSKNHIFYPLYIANNFNKKLCTFVTSVSTSISTSQISAIIIFYRLQSQSRIFASSVFFHNSLTLLLLLPRQYAKMRYYEQRYPEVDELVMVQVRQIAEMGAYVKLVCSPFLQFW